MSPQQRCGGLRAQIARYPDAMDWREQMADAVRVITAKDIFQTRVRRYIVLTILNNFVRHSQPMPLNGEDVNIHLV